MHSTRPLMNIQDLVNMMIDGSTLPTVPATAEQPKDAASLTSWAVAKSKALRPDKILRLQQQYSPQRLIHLNTRARQGRSHTNRLDFTRPQNIDAIFIYIYGTLQETPCDQCRKGRGIFDGCVTLDGLAAGACANCAYSSRGRLCHFHHHNESGASDLSNTLNTLTASQWQAVGELFQQFAREQAEAVAERASPS